MLTQEYAQAIFPFVFPPPIIPLFKPVGSSGNIILRLPCSPLKHSADLEKHNRGVIDPKTGKSIISGKVVTGYATKGEKETRLLKKITSWNRPTIEQAAAAAGATFVSSPEDVFEPFTHTDGVDGRIVTGANPLSAILTAEEAVKAFDKL